MRYIHPTDWGEARAIVKNGRSFNLPQTIAKLMVSRAGLEPATR